MFLDDVSTWQGLTGPSYGQPPSASRRSADGGGVHLAYAHLPDFAKDR